MRTRGKEGDGFQHPARRANLLSQGRGAIAHAAHLRIVENAIADAREGFDGFQHPDRRRAGASVRNRLMRRACRRRGVRREMRLQRGMRAVFAAECACGAGCVRFPSVTRRLRRRNLGRQTGRRERERSLRRLLFRQECRGECRGPTLRAALAVRLDRARRCGNGWRRWKRRGAHGICARRAEGVLPARLLRKRWRRVAARLAAPARARAALPVRLDRARGGRCGASGCP